MKEITYEYSFGITRQAAFHMIRNKMRIFLFTHPILLAIGAAALYIDIYRSPSNYGIIFMLIGVCSFSIVAVTTILTPHVIYSSNMKTAKSVFKGISDRTFILQFTDETVNIKTPVVRTELSWKTFTKVSKTKSFWYLWFHDQIHVALPASLVDDELAQLIQKNTGKPSRH